LLDDPFPFGETLFEDFYLAGVRAAELLLGFTVPDCWGFVVVFRAGEGLVGDW